MICKKTHSSTNTRSLALLSCLFFVAQAGAIAQTNQINAAIDTARMTTVRGNVSALARPDNDLGLTDAQRTLNHISINFKPTAAQQADLNQLLADQQNPASPNFHVWLTPEQYGDRFGLSPADLAQVVDWLRRSGFRVSGSASARNWVAFDGTVDAVQRVFHTEIHNYRVNGETHFANSEAPAVPAAIAPLVSGIAGLDDFLPTPAARQMNVPAHGSPKFNNSNGVHILAPDDYATIYDINPLYKAGFDGTGQSIAVLGQSDITASDIAVFRAETGLPVINLTQILVPGTTDPGHSSVNETEADLDLEWAGAIARNAAIVYVYSSNAFFAAQYALSPPLGQPIPGQVVSYSFGVCEAKAGGSLASWEPMVLQGNAEGITFVAASGDAGAGGCDLQGAAASATGGLAVAVPASVPEVTAVGGTEFNEGSGTYWGTSNSATLGSALSYIPETAWNQSGSKGLAASGGGVSGYYSTPVWQTGLSGVPAGNFRAVPDVALAAAAGNDAYLVVSSAYSGQPQCATATGYCSTGGSSAATPSFAGMVAILNQYATSKSLLVGAGQGNINPELYKLSITAPNAFHDITTGNNIVPCKTGSTGCPSSGSYGYSAGAGYDVVTGLGSVDANNLITQWYGKSIVSTTTAVTPNPAIFTVGSSVILTASVTGTGRTPTGSVSFATAGVTLGTAPLSGGTASLTVAGNLFALGTDTITAVYSGDSSFDGSESLTTVTVNLSSNASAVVAAVSPSPVIQQGSNWFFTVTLTETAGTSTMLTNFSINGVSYSAQIGKLFGTASIPGSGSIAANMTVSGITSPASLVFGGIDPGGKTWTQSATVSLAAAQASAALMLTSVPATIYQNPAAASNCQWQQSLAVQELNGYPVTLNSLSLAGTDVSSSLTAYFGTTQLNAFGVLQTLSFCWPQLTPPQTLTYQIGGVDSKGNKVSATASTVFNSAPATASTLSLSQSLGIFQLGGSTQSSSSTVGVIVSPGVAWSVSSLPTNSATSWLSVSPAAGVGPTNVTVTVNGAGVTGNGASAILVFQAPQTMQGSVNLPVSLTIGGNPVVINAGGVVPVDSTATALQPGSWASIYGANLAAATAIWNGDFPTSLGGVTVTIDNRPVYLWFVSAGQINFQVPADTSTGPVSLTVENSFGRATTTVTLAQQGPAFLLLGDNTHATGLIIDPNGGGSQGGGTYDLLGPTSAGAGFRPAKSGETVVLYGVGFGPTNPSVAPGRLYSGAAPLITTPQVTVGGVAVQLSFGGLVSAGLYQFSFNLPANLASGDQPLLAVVNGVQTQFNVFVPVQ